MRVLKLDFQTGVESRGHAWLHGVHLGMARGAWSARGAASAGRVSCTVGVRYVHKRSRWGQKGLLCGELERPKRKKPSKQKKKESIKETEAENVGRSMARRLVWANGLC